MRAVAAAALLALAPAAAAHASGPGTAAAGRALADELCSGCHAVAGAGPGPVADAPAFADIARRWTGEELGEALAEGIMVGHGSVEMPAFSLDPDAIDDLVAYLDSLAGR